ncbi:MAG TPA: aldo/keto reductase, partial [Planctomycetaceae bacterium]|nr:aldo/keto reductase [Planctomycetaceae bacterium]
MIPTRPLGRTGLQLSVIGFGAFKIGRNQGIKYPRSYPLPDEPAVERLLNAVLDAGITYI